MLLECRLGAADRTVSRHTLSHCGSKAEYLTQLATFQLAQHAVLCSEVSLILPCVHLSPLCARKLLLPCWLLLLLGLCHAALLLLPCCCCSCSISLLAQPLLLPRLVLVLQQDSAISVKGTSTGDAGSAWAWTLLAFFSGLSNFAENAAVSAISHSWQLCADAPADQRRRMLLLCIHSSLWP